MDALYCIPPNSGGSDNLTTYLPRAQALGCLPSFGDSTGLVTAWPSVVVTSTVLAPAVIADDTGQATLAEVQNAQTLATNAETSKANAIATANANLQNLVAQLAPGLSQAQTDISTLASSSDPNAPIISRCVQGVATLAQAVQDALVYLEIISG